MFRRILVPLDGSPLAEGILPYVRILARGLGVKVHLLQVLDPDKVRDAADPEAGMWVDQVAESARADALEYLKDVGRTMGVDYARVEYVVEEGNVPDAILRAAGDDPETLVAMATHGRSGLGRVLMGSVAARVLDRTSSPVLLSKSREAALREGEYPLKYAIVPLDGSPEAESILPVVSDLARATGMEVLLVTVLDSTTALSEVSGVRLTPEIGTRGTEGELVTYLQVQADQLQRQGVPRVAVRGVTGGVADSIAELTQEFPESLVAMATHGHTGLGDRLSGTNTDKVVRQSDVPVLVLRSGLRR